MSTGSVNNSLDLISSDYQSSNQTKTDKEEALGRDTFLTMLVAQLENQDPLNPMDGTDFSAQLAQFSQLEQLINLNESMESLAGAFTDNAEGDVMQYLGKQVTGNADMMNVEEGVVSGGFYNLSAPSEVVIKITDSDGNTVKTLNEGLKGSGSQLISWDGTNNAGDAVEDGSYHYTVMANSGSGYVEIPASLTGTVDGITYNNGTPYLVVEGILLDPRSLTAVIDDSSSTLPDGSSDNAMAYLGKTVSSDAPIVLVEDGDVSGDDLTFELSAARDVEIKIYNVYDEVVRKINLSADETSGGENSFSWDGLADTGYKVENGMYYYTVKTASDFAETPVNGTVSGIKNMNGSQYLVLDNSGRLVSMANITGISL